MYENENVKNSIYWKPCNQKAENLTLLFSLMLAQFSKGFPGGSYSKESACSIPGLGRSPGEGNGDPLQYSCLGNPIDREAWRAYRPGSHKESRYVWETNTHSSLSHGDSWSFDIYCLSPSRDQFLGLLVFSICPEHYPLTSTCTFPSSQPSEICPFWFQALCSPIQTDLQKDWPQPSTLRQY